jgi:NifU-like protein involved in Fe-S cluster formation
MWHNPLAYPLVWEHLCHPQNTQALLGHADVLSSQLGDITRGNVVQWQLQLAPEMQIISAICYRVYGCGFQLAACSWWSTFVLGQSVFEVPNDGAEILIAQMQLPNEKKHTAYLAVDAFMQTIAKIAKLNVTTD